jgi:hypothetical protein
MLKLTTTNMKNTQKKAKRSLSSSSSSSQSSSSAPPKETFPYNSKSWPRLISIKAIPQHTLPKNPFLVAKTIQSVAGELKTVKRLRDDSLLLECVSFQQAKNLLSLTQFAGTPVLSAPHRTLNSCRGIIRDRERSLQALSEDDIAEELKPQGISSVKRFSINKDGKTVPSATLPSNIKAGYLNFRVEVYVPNPLRCFTCQQYGHGTRTCKNPPACRRCCSTEHDSDSCSNSPYCCNCKGDHMPSSKQCPAWIRESAINRLKHERNISFPEARKIYNNSSSSSSSTSYATVAKSKVIKPSTRTVECQTTVTWIGTENPMSIPVPTVSVAHADAFAQTQVQQKTKATNIKTPTVKSASRFPPLVDPYLPILKPSSQTSSKSSTSSQPPLSPSKSSSSASKSSSSPSQRSKGKTKKAAKAQSGRPHKGEDDPIQSFNRYSSLDEMDVDPSPTTSRPVSVSPRRGRRRSPVKHPS